MLNLAPSMMLIYAKIGYFSSLYYNLEPVTIVVYHSMASSSGSFGIFTEFISPDLFSVESEDVAGWQVKGANESRERERLVYGRRRGLLLGY